MYQLKRHCDRFSHFCIHHSKVCQCFGGRTTPRFLFAMGDLDMVVWAHLSQPPNGICISLTVLAGFMFVTNRQTMMQSIFSNRPHLMHIKNELEPFSIQLSGLSAHVRFCCLFQFLSIKPRDWLERTSAKWPISCRLGRKTLTQSINPYRAHSSSLIAIAHPPASSTLRVTYHFFQCASTCLWNQLPVFFPSASTYSSLFSHAILPFPID